MLKTSEYKTMPISQEIFLRKRNKIFLENISGQEDNTSIVLAFNKNLENLGFCLDKYLFDVLKRLSTNTIIEIYHEIVPILNKMVGNHRQFSPMYPNFPKQVMEISNAELYMNALMHYWGSLLKDVSGTEISILPNYEKEERAELDEFVKLKIIGLGTRTEFENIFKQLIASNSSLSESDKEIVTWFTKSHPNIDKILPDNIPQKETLCLLVGLFLKTNNNNCLYKYLKTATDVLRVAVAMSSGDVSLTKPTKFRNFTRQERRFLLNALENCGNITEDMLRYKERWKRLGEKLHPFEYKNLERTIEAFKVIRNNLPYKTFASRLEEYIKNKDIINAVDLLSQRPGIFARRLDHLLRLANNNTDVEAKIIREFTSVSHKIATPVLLQCFNHFRYRKSDIRTFFPKGNVAKLQISEKSLPEINSQISRTVASIIKQTLVERFKELSPLGKCYINPQLKEQIVPFAQRSASKTIRTLARGSRIALPDTNVLRFFLWWKNGDSRTDIDLSAVCFSDDWSKRTDISYYNLRDLGGCHSGDITDAPRGACEFIDISIDEMLKHDYRYVIMSLNSFTGQSYNTLPECFAGWMARSKPQSGEIFEPKTVIDKIDLTANSKIAVPIIFDLKERKAIWVDLSLSHNIRYYNNVSANSKSLASIGKAMVSLNKPNLYDLFMMHIDARGQIANKEDSENVFDLDDAFSGDKIMSEYMA